MALVGSMAGDMTDTSRSMPKPLRVLLPVAVAALTVTLVLVFTVFNDDDDPSAAPSATESPTPTTPETPARKTPAREAPTPTPEPATPSPAETPSPSPRPEPPSFPEPEWSRELATGDGIGPMEITDVTDGYLVVTPEHLHGLASDGETRWKRAVDSDFSSWIAADGDVVVVSHTNPKTDRWPQPDVVMAIDTTSGKTLWKDGRSSFQGVFQETAYLTTCNGQQNGQFGNCRLAARDPETGDARWTINTEASAQVRVDGDDGSPLHAPPEPPFLMLETFPHGAEDRTIRTLDPASGNWLRASFQDWYSTQPVAATDTLIAAAHPGDVEARKGCEPVTLTALSLHGNDERWQRSLDRPLHRIPDGEGNMTKECSWVNTIEGLDDAMAVSQHGRAPLVIDLLTGETLWKLTTSDTIIGARDDVLLAQRVKNKKDPGKMTLYDVRTGKARWTSSAPTSWDGSEPQAIILHDQVVTYDPNYDTCASPTGGKRCSGVAAYDLESGKTLAAPEGEYGGAGANWVGAWTGHRSDDTVEFSLYPIVFDAQRNN